MLKRSMTPQARQEAPERTSSPALPAPAVSHLIGVVSLAVLGSALALSRFPGLDLQLVFLWTAACLAGEMLLFSTASGRAHINLATSMHLAMVLFLDPGHLVAAVVLSRVAAKFVLKRQVWYRALFNVAQVTVAVLAASLVYRTLAGPSALEFTLPALVQMAPPYALAALVYYLANIGAVTGIITLTSGDRFLRVWRENYGYAAELLSTAGLVALAPVVTLCFAQIGWPGLVIFLLPMLLVRLSSVRYIALRQAQQDLIASERLAAKGEIAAEVGHEINNYLAAVYSNLQLMMLKDGPEAQEIAKNRLQDVIGQLDNIRNLSRGLLEFSQRETQLMPTRINDLVHTTVAFLKPQNRFDGVDVRLDLDPRAGEVLADSAQIQQALMNLMLNAANAMTESGSRKKILAVWVRLHDVSRQLEIGVADSGPGVPAALRDRIFEPGFTTRTDGHGYGLSTSHRIVANHDGNLSVADSPFGGALFRIELPLNHRLDQAA